MKRSHVRRARIALAVSVGAFGLGGVARGQVAYWDSNGATTGAGVTPTGTWGADAFWSADPNGEAATAAWVDGSTAVFSAGTDAVGPYTVTVTGTQIAAGVTVEEGPLTLAGGTLNVGGFNVAPATTATVTSVLTVGPITKSGGGTLVLGADINQLNTFSKLAISGGVVQFAGERVSTLGAANALGTTPATAVADYITLSNGGTLRSTRNGAGSSFLLPTRGVTLGTGGGAFDVADGTATNRLIYNGVITGTGGLTKAGPGLLEIQSAANNYSGDTVLSQGTLSITGSSVLGNGAGTLRFAGGKLNTTATRVIANALPHALSIEANSTIDTTSTAVTKRLTFSTNTIATNPAFTLSIRNTQATPSTTFQVRFTGSGFDFTSPLVLGQAGDTGGSALLELFNVSGVQTFSNVISGTGSVNRSIGSGPSGETVFSAANTYSGNTSVRAGFIGVGSSTVLSGSTIVSGPIGTGTFTVGDDTFALGLYASGGARTIANPVTIEATIEPTPTPFEIKGSNALELAGPITFTAPRIVKTSNTGGTLFSGVVSGGAPATVTKAGDETLTLSGVNTYAGGTVVDAGTLVAANADALGTGGLTVNNATARAQAALPKAVSVATVTLTGTGALDMTDNDLVIKTSTLAAVQAQITAGFNGGTWNGAGINSSAAATNANGTTALGYGDNAELGLTTFSGVALTGPEIVVKYTYYGDADLTGVVDLDDFGLFLTGYQTPSLPRTWIYGDFDYTGVIDLDDFGLFLFGYQNQGGPLSALSEAVADASGISSGDRAAMQAAISAVPEPAALGVLGVAGLGLLRRRRRSA